MSETKERHSRMAYSGDAKKGGAGGKFTWGKPGDEVNAPARLDPKDPDYDSEDEDAVFAQVYASENVQLPHEAATKILTEYFESEDIGEVARSLQDAKALRSYSEFVKYAVRTAMERHDRERELTSRLFSYLYGSVLPSHQIAEGFRILIDSIDDIILDNPNAVHLLAKFITRAIADETIPPSFLRRTRARSKAGDEVLSEAGQSWNSESRAHLDHIWGPSAAGSVKKLKASLREVVSEYVSSGELADAEASLREFHVPAFHFGFVKITVDIALSDGPAARKRIVELLTKLKATGLLTPPQLESGLRAGVASVVDFVKDISPAADKDLLLLLHEAAAAGLVGAEFVAEAEGQVPAQLAADKKQREESLRRLQESRQ